MKIPREKSVVAIDLWEESFFQSEFTHASGVRKHVRFRGGFLAMWQSLAEKKAFPEKYLVKLPRTLAEFVRNDDHSYRNDNRQRTHAAAKHPVLLSNLPCCTPLALLGEPMAQAIDRPR